MQTAPRMTPAIRLRHRLGRALAYAIAAAAVGGAAWSVWSWQPAVWAQQHLDRARVLSDRNDTERARATLRELLRRLPMRREVRWQLIQLELADRRFEQAYLEVKAYSELFPDATEAWMLLANLMNGGGLLDEAEVAAANAVDSAPDAPEPRALRALIRLRRGRLFGARVDAEAILAKDPGNETQRALLARLETLQPAPPRTAHVHRGAPRERGELAESHAMVWPGTLAVLRRDSDTAMHDKNWRGADEVAAKARQAYPGSVIGPWISGVSAMAQDNFTAAERYFDEALVAAPRSALIVKGLAQVWARDGGAVGAGDRLMALVRRDPGFAFARRHAANNYLNARRPDLAEDALRQGVSDPGDVGAWRDLAAFYLGLDRAGDALNTCRDALAKYPHDLALQSLAARLTARSEPATAIAQYEQILEAQPDRTGDAVALANLLLDTAAGKPRALELMRQAVADAPTELEDIDGLGWALLRSGSTPAAIPWLEAASQAAPDRPDIRYHLAAAYAQAGRKKEALAHLDFALKSGAPFSEQPQAQKLQRSLRP